MAKSKVAIDKVIRQNPHCLLISEISGNDKEEAERVLEEIRKKGKLNNVKYLKTKYNELKR
jgi:methylmalonyl-CoA mutase cobalamin-binding subunit